ncbi:unnamed protein product [Parnassius mnemosyne]|uniref:MADF domain-containing protein n=1 Tax=Parnassius mnemosyne TaxID=213953 RepID=A0AAV1LZ26_9NEOP
MEWTSDHTLEFIRLIKREPILWNPNITNCKSRNLAIDAWTRVKNEFSLPMTVKELKKKKNCLFTQYRFYMKRIKGTSKCRTEANEIYQPSWFAFNLMNSFLCDVYDIQSTLNHEELNDFETKRSLSCESNIENTKYSSSSEVFINRPLSRNSSTSSTDGFLNTSRKRRRPNVVTVKQQTKPAFPITKEKSVHKEFKKEDDECDLYLQLLARKLKKLDEDNRLKLMNDIDNLTFKYLMADRAQNCIELSTSLPTTLTLQTNSNNQVLSSSLDPLQLEMLPPEVVTTHCENK